MPLKACSPSQRNRHEQCQPTWLLRKPYLMPVMPAQGFRCPSFQRAPTVGFYGGHAMNSVRNTAHSILSHFVYCFSFCLFRPLTRHLLCWMYDNGAGLCRL